MCVMIFSRLALRARVPCPLLQPSPTKFVVALLTHHLRIRRYSELEGLLVELRKADRAHKQSFGLGGPGRGSGLQQVEAAWSGYAEVASEVAVLERHVPL